MLSATLSTRPDLDIIVRAKDPPGAADRAEEALRKVGARSIERSTREGRVTLTARIRPEDLEALRETLASLGPLSESAAAAPRPGAPLACGWKSDPSSRYSDRFGFLDPAVRRLRTVPRRLKPLPGLRFWGGTEPRSTQWNPWPGTCIAS
jgi:hypothetical protein